MCVLLNNRNINNIMVMECIQKIAFFTIIFKSTSTNLVITVML